ncbi:uncharacterized protein LAESUDRAFT_728336 [Laetiporus sulphureus 93-53]|uniref:Hypervirulence associated protein TUDOR domain-containing protein n=1 Tax=Laetiporus sulphureus 93-53 TaxID=1314785 RepID=A0A165D4D6_9APHY|nr:uncharacterized protein LAESUDRAFT_728336 [Laetiporus sulphureus 93-53]KZT04136.1 hypothetical protein LAESUDRAFT_728336 [Laetiporus sulphureus 93-53]
MAADFDARTRYRLNDEVRFWWGSPGQERVLVGRVYAIQMTQDLRVAYAIEVVDDNADQRRTRHLRVPERAIRGLTRNNPLLRRLRHRLHLR